MNRKLGFRLWSDADKEYRTDCKLVFNCKAGTPSTVFSDEGDCFVIEQYTGLKDKNGTEIYEGDIVRLSVEDDFKKEYFSYYKHELPLGVHKVAFDNGTFSICENAEWRFLLGQYRSNEIEVIGNIHENPELLK